MPGTHECFDDVLNEYGDCATHFQRPGGYIYRCTSADQTLCGSAAGGYLGEYENVTFMHNIAGIYALDGTPIVLTESGSTSFLPELTLEEGGQLAGAIIALWALGFCLRALRKHLEEL